MMKEKWQEQFKGLNGFFKFWFIVGSAGWLIVYANMAARIYNVPAEENLACSLAVAVMTVAEFIVWGADDRWAGVRKAETPEKKGSSLIFHNVMIAVLEVIWLLLFMVIWKKGGVIQTPMEAGNIVTLFLIGILITVAGTGIYLRLSRKY